MLYDYCRENPIDMPWIFKARRVDEMMRKKTAGMPDLLFLTLFGTDSSKIELGPRRYQYFQESYFVHAAIIFIRIHGPCPSKSIRPIRICCESLCKQLHFTRDLPEIPCKMQWFSLGSIGHALQNPLET
jgi:hypothetical protein